MVSFLRIVGGFLLALIALTILGTAAAAQHALSAIANLGINIPLTTWISTTLQDIVGMAPIYAVIFGIGLLLGLVGAAIASRWIPLPRNLIYAVAGFVAIFTTLIAIKAAFFGITPIAAARFWTGFIIQCMIGSFAAYIFAVTTPKKT